MTERTMDKKTLRQCVLDVVRLENAADRMAKLADDYETALARLESAKQSLRIISIWAMTPDPKGDAKNLRDIHNRCMDTLKLIEDAKHFME